MDEGTTPPKFYFKSYANLGSVSLSGTAKSGLRYRLCYGGSLIGIKKNEGWLNWGSTGVVGFYVIGFKPNSQLLLNTSNSRLLKKHQIKKKGQRQNQRQRLKVREAARITYNGQNA